MRANYGASVEEVASTVRDSRARIFRKRVKFFDEVKMRDMKEAKRKN